MIRLLAAGRTHTGHVRSANQDSWVSLDDRLYAVADGMGGHRGGEVASSTIVDTLSRTFLSTTAPLDADDVERAIHAANAAVLERATADPDLAGMGSTLVALSVGTDTDGTDLLSVHNVGDSRAYRLRIGELDPLTDDHSLVAEMVRSGRLTPDEARVHRQRSVLTRAMGTDSAVEVDRTDVTPMAGDRYLLCSDGLHGEVTEADIAAVLRRVQGPAAAADELVRIALEAGGRDNVTVIVIDVVDDGDASLAASKKVTATGGSSGRSATSSPSEAPQGRVERSGGGARSSDAPRVITPRLVAFVTILLALALVLVWTLRSAPGTDGVSTDSTTAVVTTTTVDPFSADAPDPALELGTTVPGGIVPAAGVVVTSVLAVPAGATTTSTTTPLPATTRPRTTRANGTR